MAKQKKSFGQKIANSKKQFFVGREVQIQKFQQNIKLDPYDDDFLNIINVFGQGGVGKTTLLNKYLSICKSENYCVSFLDIEDASIYEVTETMNSIANSFEKQELSFKRFTTKYKKYLKERGKLEADPNKPKGTLGKIVKASIKIGSKIGSSTLPGSGLILDTPITDTAAEIASEWADFVVTKLTNEDEIELVLNPLKVLTPIWIEELFEASEKKKLALFFDTFEESNPELEKWLIEFLKEYYGEIPSILLVVGGRNVLDQEKWSKFETHTYKIKLEPFNKVEAITYLEQRGISKPVLIDQLLAISGCLPVYLSLLVDGDPSNSEEIFDPSEKIVERFLRHIDNHVLRDLALCASLPSQFNQDVVECLLPDQEKTNSNLHFEWLKQKPFVEKRNRSYWSYHPIVREIMQRHLKEISDKAWEKHHLSLVEWYEVKSAKLEINGSRDAWFNDRNWRRILFEKHFHLLCCNYKKYLSGAIQDFIKLLFNHSPASTIPLIVTLNNVEKILEVTNGIGEILLKGVGGLMVLEGGIIVDEKEYILKMFSTINQHDFIVQQDERSNLALTQGLFEPDLKQAIACYQKAVEIKSNNYEAYHMMGVAFSIDGNQARAIECYQKAINIKPDKHEVFFNMGHVYYNKGDYIQAIDCYYKVIEIKPDKYEAFLYTGNIYLVLGDQKKAIEWYKKALENKQDYYEASFNLGLAYFYSGDQNHAKEWFQRAVEINPNSPDSFTRMGLAYSEKGYKEQAIEFYQKALEIKPDLFETYHNMGNAYYFKGEVDQAIACYEKALTIKPDFKETLNTLGWVNLLLLKFEEAKTHLQKAWAVSKNSDAYAAMNLGHISLLNDHDISAAKNWYKKSIALKEVLSDFLNEMEFDFSGLQMERFGINKEKYSKILEELKNDLNP